MRSKENETKKPKIVKRNQSFRLVLNLEGLCIERIVITVMTKLEEIVLDSSCRNSHSTCAQEVCRW